MRVTIEVDGYKLVVEPEQVEEFELSTPITPEGFAVLLRAALKSQPLWEVA